jgi:hypothetical protein
MLTENKKMLRNLGRRLNHSASACGAFAKTTITGLILALGLGLITGTTAMASIVYTPVSETLSGNDSLDFLDYPGSGTQFTLYHWDWSIPGSPNSGADIGDFNLVATDLNGYASVLTGGDEISGSLNWRTYATLGAVDNSGPSGLWLGQTGFLGLQFDPGDGTHYGWIELSMLADASSLTIYGYAYETATDTPIAAGAGAVPLPASLVFLASGLVGLLAYHRRKSPT